MGVFKRASEGKLEGEPDRFEVRDGAEEGEVSEAASHAFGELDLLVDGFHGGAGDTASEEAEDAVPVTLESLRRLSFPTAPSVAHSKQRGARSWESYRWETPKNRM